MCPWGNPNAYDRRICEDGKLRTFTFTGVTKWDDVDRGYVSAKDELTGKWYKVVGFGSGNKFVANRRSKHAHLVNPDLPKPDPRGPFFMKEGQLTTDERAAALRIPLGPPGSGGISPPKKERTKEELNEIFGLDDD